MLKLTIQNNNDSMVTYIIKVEVALLMSTLSDVSGTVEGRGKEETPKKGMA